MTQKRSRPCVEGICWIVGLGLAEEAPAGPSLFGKSECDAGSFVLERPVRKIIWQGLLALAERCQVQLSEVIDRVDAHAGLTRQTAATTLQWMPSMHARRRRGVREHPDGA